MTNAERLEAMYEQFRAQGRDRHGARAVGRSLQSGIEFEMTLGQVSEFRDGRVVRQTMYRDPEEARAAAQELVSAGGV